MNENVSQWMSDLISGALSEDEDIIPSRVAAELLADARAHEPDALAEWLDMHAEAILRDAITTVIRSRRARSRSKAVSGAFAKAARAYEGGDLAALSPFNQRYVVDGSETQRRVRDMTRTDCLFVADRYAISADRNALLSLFHRAVATRVGDQTVGAVYSETEYDRLYRSLVKQSPEAVAG